MSDMNPNTSDTLGTAPPPASAKSRKLMWVLVASLLANAALAGVLLGHAGRDGLHLGMMGRGGDRMADRMGDRGGERGPDRADKNSDDRRAERPRESDESRQARRAVMREAFDAERPVLDKALDDLTAARKNTATLIRAENLDPVALDTALAQMRLHSDEALASFHRAIAASAAKLDAEQRRVLARMLDRMPQRRPPPPPKP